ncbi:cation:proton antiporter [Kitasatospora sp. NPDC049285]|uniref:cation:proton antiporter n=1 Tax=Kitasatospora sp. NPDC049285 TaxID=3157096 RepID=UPI003432C6F1
MPSNLLPVPPLPAHQLLLFLLQLGVLLLLALVLGQLAGRIGLPAVVGELAAGVLVGPTLLGRAAPELSRWFLPPVSDQFHLLDAVGQLGVILLVAVTGTEMDTALVRRRGAAALGVGVAGLVVPLGLGIAAGYLVPRPLLTDGADRLVFALFLGVALCVSAIPVIAKILADMDLLHRDVGQLTLAAGMIDDVIGWLLLAVVSAMATGGVDGSAAAWSVVRVALVLALAATLGRPLVRGLTRWAARRAGSAPAATAVALVVLCAAGTHALGLEAMFGAFLAGLLLGGAGTAGAGGVAPLRTVVLGVLAPLFFASAGLRIDLAALARPTVLATATGVLLVAVAGKFAGAFLGARAGRLGRWEALAVGAGMNARGVIQIIVATAGLRLGILTPSVYTIVILTAILTSVMAPPILGYATRRITPTADEEARRRRALAAQSDLPFTPANWRTPVAPQQR